MIEIRTTSGYDKWFGRLRDERAKARINARLIRLVVGNPGDINGLGGGISELRVDYGPGYRIYLTRRGNIYVLLLCGGDKSTQQSDIAQARKLAAELMD
jgi:putative addiction module killer protein